MEYVNSSLDLALVFKAWRGKGKLPHCVYADSDFITDVVDGLSTYGYSTHLGNDTTHWKSKKDSTISTSTATAKLSGMYHGLTQALWEDGFYKELGVTEGPFTIYCDNKSTVDIVNRENQLDRTKHETVKIEFIREKVRMGLCKVLLIPTEEMRADIFTKGLGNFLFHKHAKSLGMETRVNIE